MGLMLITQWIAGESQQHPKKRDRRERDVRALV